MSPLFYESLSNEERLRRIGAILGKAVALQVERERAEREAFEAESDKAQSSRLEHSSPDASAESLTSGEQMLLRKTAIIGYLHPRDVTIFFDVSRTTAYR